ncbi:MAG: glycosyltransferase family 4 protein [Actinomycetia bacterium]|nr:glycosyltransferase family 4 protein [Actinomycetes bacterium]
MRDRLRIAVFHDLPSGGGKRALFEYCRELTRRGHVVDAYIPESANEVFLPLDEVVRDKRVYPVRFQEMTSKIARGSNPLFRFIGFHLRLFGLVLCQRQIARDVNAGVYDLAFVHHSAYTQSPFILRYLKIPSLYYLEEPNRWLYEAPLAEHGVPGRSLSSSYSRVMLRRIDRTNTMLATSILTNSYYSHESILRAYGTNSQVCYLGVNTDTFHRVGGRRRGDYVLSVGGLHVEKGFRFIIRALGQLERSIRPRLVIVADRGESPEREALLQMARKYDVSVDIVSNVSDEELCAYYNEALLVIFAPYLEPFGFVPLEAMACGTPVVGVREGGIRETVEDGGTGLLVDRDVETFSEAVKYLLENDQVAEEMGLRGFEVVGANWTWEASTDRLLARVHETIALVPSRTTT